MNEKQQKVMTILADVLEKPVESIKPEHELKGDLEVDSAQAMELLATIEETFDMDISEVEAAKVAKVQDLLDLAKG